MSGDRVTGLTTILDLQDGVGSYDEPKYKYDCISIACVRMLIFASSRSMIQPQTILLEATST